jgi:hypothetical protein
MHSAKPRMPFIARCITASFAPPLFGSRCAQAVWAVSYRESLTPNCCAVPFGIVPLLAGSGKLGTPWVRMHRENPIADREIGDPPAFVGPPEPAEEPVHAVADTARTAAERKAAAVRIVGGSPRDAGRRRRVRSVIMSSSAAVMEAVRLGTRSRGRRS